MERFNLYIQKSGCDAKPHQAEGVEWMVANETRPSPPMHCRGGFIADEMGLGKTIMMIGTLLANLLTRTLIVLPPALVEQWYREIHRTTGHRAVIYHGAKAKDFDAEKLASARIVITTYAMISVTYKETKDKKTGLPKKKKDPNVLHQVRWNRVVFDEAHHLRNRNSRWYGATLLKTSIRWLISGTPVQNSRSDFNHLCDILGLTEWVHCDNGKKSIIDTFMLRRTKKQVGIEIPDVQTVSCNIEWKNVQEHKLSAVVHTMYKRYISAVELRLPALMRCRQSCIYAGMLNRPRKMVIDIDSKEKEKQERIEREKMRTKKYRLIVKNKEPTQVPPQQTAIDVDGMIQDTFTALPGCDFAAATSSSSKIDLVVAQLLARRGNGNGKIVFCHFRDEIDAIVRGLEVAGFHDIQFVDGRISKAKRDDIFAGNAEVLLLQIQTGCEGLNLQKNYSEVYFVSPHWNPAIEEQAIARCHRIGQTKEVHVFRFIMNGETIEHHIQKTQEKKNTYRDQIFALEPAP